jgi:hypothetical protein
MTSYGSFYPITRRDIAFWIHQPRKAFSEILTDIMISDWAGGVQALQYRRAYIEIYRKA